MKFFVSFALMMISAIGYSQITIYAGSSLAKSPDLNMTPSGTSHTGYVTGINLRMLDDGMCFLFTAEYGAFNLLARDKVDFTTKNKDLTYYKGKFGVGLDVVQLSQHAKLRTKLQGNILYIRTFNPANLSATPAMRETGYHTLNEAIGGLSTGVGFTYRFIDLDLEYEHGFYNIYYRMPLTKMNFINITAGIRI